MVQHFIKHSGTGEKQALAGRMSIEADGDEDELVTACQEVLLGLKTGKVSKGDLEEAKTKVQEVLGLPLCYRDLTVTIHPRLGAVSRKTSIDCNRSYSALVSRLRIAAVFSAVLAYCRHLLCTCAWPVACECSCLCVSCACWCCPSSSE